MYLYTQIWEIIKNFLGFPTNYTCSQKEFYWNCLNNFHYVPWHFSICILFCWYFCCAASPGARRYFACAEKGREASGNELTRKGRRTKHSNSCTHNATRFGVVSKRSKGHTRTANTHTHTRITIDCGQVARVSPRVSLEFCLCVCVWNEAAKIACATCGHQL